MHLADPLVYRTGLACGSRHAKTEAVASVVSGVWGARATERENRRVAAQLDDQNGERGKERKK